VTQALDVQAMIDPARVVEITSRICSARSVDGTEGAVGEVVAELLDQPGVDVEVEYVLPGRPNVIATVRGAGGPGLLLNGHIDASYAPAEQWSRDPHEPWVAGGRMYGAAITDMLGAVGAMVAAVEAAARVELPGDLVLLASMHHDTIGLGVKYALASGDEWPRYGICGEPSSLEIHTANGGALKFDVEFSGRFAHISRLEGAADALAAAVDFSRALRDYDFAHEPHPRLPDLPRLLVGQLEGGFAPGAVADHAVVSCDLRTVPGMARAAVRAELEALAAAACPEGVGARVRFSARQRAFIGPAEGPLLEALGSAHERVRGSAPVVTSRLPGQAFVTDAADMQALGVETLVYGPCDWFYAPDESVPVEDLADAARVYLETALALE
jgi:acetylornithine deacetylase